MSSLVSCFLTLRHHPSHCDFDSRPMVLVSGFLSPERDNVVYWKTKRKINNDLQFSLSIHAHTHIHIVTIIVYFIFHVLTEPAPARLNRLVVPVTYLFMILNPHCKRAKYSRILN